MSRNDENGIMSGQKNALSAKPSFTCRNCLTWSTCTTKFIQKHTLHTHKNMYAKCM